jgi:DNA-binding response OmpR family regulator
LQRHLCKYPRAYLPPRLLARLRAAIRRGSSEPANPVIETADFTVDLAAGRVTADGRDVKLTPTEWHLLEVLARNPGKVVEHGRLLTEVWGPAYQEQTNYLRVYMATLRRKLEPDAANPPIPAHQRRARLPLRALSRATASAAVVEGESSSS